MELDLEPGERAYLKEVRALTQDMHGNEVFAGLSFEESVWYRNHCRQWVSGNDPHDAVADDRYTELNDRHERARFNIIGAEHQMRVASPTLQ